MKFKDFKIIKFGKQKPHKSKKYECCNYCPGCGLPGGRMCNPIKTTCGY